MSAILLFARSNPLLIVIGVLVIALGFYKVRASYLDAQNRAAECVIEMQNKTIKSVEVKNEVHQSINSLSDSDVHKRLRAAWCRDCELLPAE